MQDETQAAEDRGGRRAPRVEARGLTRRLRSGSRTLTVLADVDLAVGPGECVAILGPSGSGKSTLLGLLAGLDRPSAGEVLIEGVPLSSLDEDGLAELRRDRIGFVFQSFQLLGNLTARENVLLPLELARVRGARARADEILDAVGLAERAHHYPSQLSGGEQQRVALARAFGPRPRLLLADEPTGNLDGETGARVLDLIERLRREEGSSLVLVTHDPEVAGRAERRVVLRDGRIERVEHGLLRTGEPGEHSEHGEHDEPLEPGGRRQGLRGLEGDAPVAPPRSGVERRP